MTSTVPPPMRPEPDLPAVIEAMLFASASEPVLMEEIRAGLPECEAEQIEAGIEELERRLDRRGSGLRLERVAGGFRLVTRPEHAERLRSLFRFRNRKRLTPAALEVLAIVAYAQPITAPEIQEIRGTDPAYALRVLLDRRLIRIVGRRRVVGRPILYGTTREFLMHFGLDSLADLPPVEAFGTKVMPSQRRLFPASASDAGEEAVPAEPPAVPATPGPTGRAAPPPA
ncbi:MAG: SMC-Scp complex subunit ScpB [Acidobacteria bacterium]|nr:MAG: SMC-Scp complex subunit ScpB [Acidobacteriota bacterium]